jgi:hypothetical protein
MKLPWRRFPHPAVGAAAVPAVAHIARAQAYPTRPVRIIGTFGGGPIDISARLIAQWLSERLGQHFFVDIGDEVIVMSAPGKLVRSSRWKTGPDKRKRPLGSGRCKC